MSDHRPEPPHAGSELDVALGFLNLLRETMIWKIDGLSEAQARQTHSPSSLSILGMIQHLQYVERWWMQRVFLGHDVSIPWTDDDPDADFRIDDRDTIASVIDRYRSEVAIHNRIFADTPLDTVAASPRDDMTGLQLRWILFHLIEETGRHCGHADMIRESIDGRTGE